ARGDCCGVAFKNGSSSPEVVLANRACGSSAANRATRRRDLDQGRAWKPIDRMEFTQVFAALAEEHVQTLLVGAAAENLTNRSVDHGTRGKGQTANYVPWREFVTDGGLIGHVADLMHKYRHAAHQVSEILKGAKVGEIPFHQGSTYKLVTNLKTANELG